MQLLRFTLGSAFLILLSTQRVWAQSTDVEQSPEINEIVREMSTSGGLTVERAQTLALQNAPSVARAQAAVRIAEASARLARVGLFPELTGSFRATYLSNVQNPTLGGSTFSDADQAALHSLLAGIPDATTSGIVDTAFFALIDGITAGSSVRFPYFRSHYSFDAGLTYPVTATFLSILPVYRAAGHAREAALLQIDTENQSIRMRVQETYYENVRARGALRVAQLGLEQATSHLEQVRAFVDAGTATQADLMRLESVEASAQVAVAQAQAGVLISSRALALLIAGQDETLSEITIGEDLTAPVAAVSGSLEELESQALDTRTELEALKRMYRAQELTARAYRDGRYPQVSVSANLAYSNPNTNYFPQTREFRTTWNINAVLSWSPNDTATQQAQWHQARAELERIDADRIALIDGIRMEVAQSYETLRAARQVIRAAEVGLRASSEAYRVRTEQFQAGAAVVSDVLDTQSELARARLQWIDATVELRLARARLDRAIGAWSNSEQ